MLRVNVEEVLTLVVSAAAKFWVQWILYIPREDVVHTPLRPPSAGMLSTLYTGRHRPPTPQGVSPSPTGCTLVDMAGGMICAFVDQSVGHGIPLPWQPAEVYKAGI